MREATETVAILLSLVAPYLAEEMWERLGHQPTVARAGWPAVDEALLVEDSVTAIVQVQGKLRAKLEVSPDISAADLEAAAMADAHVQRALDGRTVRKVIVKRAPSWSTSSPADAGCRFPMRCTRKLSLPTGHVPWEVPVLQVNMGDWWPDLQRAERRLDRSARPRAGRSVLPMVASVVSASAITRPRRRG